MKPLWILTIAMIGALFAPGAVPAQFVENLGKAAGRAAESEAQRQVQHAVRNAIRCAVGDTICQQRAKQVGRPVVLVDQSGNEVAGLREAAWDLSFAGGRWEGGLGEVLEDGVLHTLHLVIPGEATLYVFLYDAHIGQHAAPGTLLVFNGGDECHFPFEGSAPHHFTVRLNHSEANWLKGSFDGRLRCALHTTPVRVTGTFRVPR